MTVYFQDDELFTIADLRRHYILMTSTGKDVVFSNAELSRLDHARLLHTQEGEPNPFGELTPDERDTLYGWIKRATSSARVKKCKTKKEAKAAKIKKKLAQKDKKIAQLKAKLREYEREGADTKGMARLRQKLKNSKEEVISNINSLFYY